MPSDAVHLLVSALPAAVQCGRDPRATLVLHVTTVDQQVTCPECAFGVVCVCAICERDIPRPGLNAEVLMTASAGAKAVCPTCASRIRETPRRACDGCGGDGGVSTEDHRRLCTGCRLERGIPRG